MAIPPTPPQGAPQPPQGGPPSPGGPQQAPGGASQLVTEIHDKLLKLMDMVQGAGLPEEDGQELGQIISAFQKFVDDLGKPEGQESEDEPGAQGPAAPEAGGNPNARPA